MHHISIAQKKSILELRSTILQALRNWFVDQGFVEIEAPVLVQTPGMEPHLSPVPVALHDNAEHRYSGYLTTSPEYTMKKCLAAGMNRIFCLGKVFRDYEYFGGAHNPEFTMLEWYRADQNMFAIMDDIQSLFAVAFVAAKKQPLLIDRMHMNDVWKRYTGLHLSDLLTTKAMQAACFDLGYHPATDEPYEDLFYRIFLNQIEPKLPKDRVTIIHHYPAQMAALAKLSADDPRYAERFEVYVGNGELANAFSELTDAVEQRARLVNEQEQRSRLGKVVFDLDEDFLAAVEAMPPAAGIALGIDRLVQLVSGTSDINQTLALCAKDLFEG